MSIELPPVPEATLATQVYQRLRGDLLEGRIPPGHKLKVLALAETYAVGPSPMREALSSLAAEGLVSRIDQRGFRAAPASVVEFDEILRARCSLESLVLRESIVAGDAAWEDALVVARHRLGRTPRHGPPDPPWEAVHAAFHRALLAGCPSATLRGFCETLRERAGRYRFLAGTAANYPTRGIADEHEALAAAALARDADAAAALLVEHYRRTGRFLREALPERA